MKRRTYNALILTIVDLMHLIVLVAAFTWLWKLIGISAEDVFTIRYWGIIFIVIFIALLSLLKRDFMESVRKKI